MRSPGVGFRPRVSRLRLAPRIGIAIVLTVGAAYLLNQSLQYLIPPPPFVMVERAWLIDSVASAAGVAETRAGAPRDKALGALAASQYLDFSVTRAASPIAQESGSLFADGLRRSIAKAVGIPAARVAVVTQVYDEQNTERSAHNAIVVIPELPAVLRSETLASSESSVLGELVISVALDDGSRLAVTQRNLTTSWRHYTRIAFGIVGNLLIVILFSVWIARSIVVPLTRLSAAIDSLGRNREPALIGEMRLPEYAAIADSFNTMQLRLKRFIDERMGMLAAISHDLRTPLTRLRLMAEYVDNPEQREQLLLNVDEMETMVGDALAFMRSEALSEKVEVADLAVLLISLTDEYGDFGHRVSYSGPEHADLPCRPVALKRAFSNLIANGCKYGGAVEVRLAVTAEAFAVDVHDEGDGIPPEYEERAFQPFERLETSRSRETGGSGLGLAISRDIVNSHAGEISFRRPAKGFIVHVRLPRPAA
ncbi:HAMP domain-containing sensor histidine kinase [Sphingopyxis sp.]|jgi:signal transduction histidine kinase|uniref:sensor histidine kinase n=1 Tax=Sphingopyxis sp. TaxID=1908224 RepID=UPI002DF53CBB|nr:HAMP domain-containing sensor histidine kinase [Sphingopyxis sp.]